MEADNEVAENCTAVLVPEVDKFASVALVKFTVGAFAVPPVNTFTPGCTLVMSFPSFVVMKMSYKFVVPE